jgi:nitroreductase
MNEMQLIDMVMDKNKALHLQDQPVTQQLVLELLNHAVWAPNHGLREPWRFIYVDNKGGNTMRTLQESASAYLIVVMKEDSNLHKRDEDFAAVCCLIQNFQLLAWEKKLGVRRTRQEWVYDQERCQLFGVQEKELIVSVLELGYYKQMPQAVLNKSIDLKFDLL